MAVDLGVFERQKTVLDQQALQEAFQLKKALAMQAAQKDALETQALQAQAANGGLTLKDMLTMQMQQQNNAENRDLRREAMDIQRQNAAANIDLRRESIDARRDANESKKNQKMLNDQNALTGILTDTDNQLSKIDALFDEGGNLKPEAAAVYGSVAGFRPPVVFQGTVDAQANIDNIINNSVFQKLGDLKAQSATGASGLGSLSNSEGTMLKSSATAAGDYKQSPEMAAKNLKAYRAQIQKSRDNLISGFNNIYGQQAQPTNASQNNAQGQDWLTQLDNQVNGQQTNVMPAKPRLKYNPATGEFE